MTRRDFMAAGAALGLLPSKSPAATAFPVHYAKSSPYESLLRLAEPGTDEFLGEKVAADLEARLVRIFDGTEAAPEALKPWLAKRLGQYRFYVLPENKVRFEIQTAGEYHTGLWNFPDFSTAVQETVAAAQPRFRDVTTHIFGNVKSFREQLLKGNPAWRTSLDSATGIDTDGNQGIAVGDIDNDGADEVYVCQSGGLPNRLYKIRQDGTALDITERAGLNILDETTAALFVDFRNTGWQDLIVLRRSGPLLFVNQRDGTFREQPDAFHFKTPPAGAFTGMAAADYDRDGRVDLYLCTYIYVQGEDQYQYPTPYHDAQNSPPNFLMRNRLTADGGAFEDVTEETGMNQNNNRFSFAAAWCDYDGSGWPSLYVANDFGRNNLYRNKDGRFEDVAAAAGVEDVGAGMSASWFDYDGDGRPDLYVSNMWSAAGQRVTRDAAFKPAKENAEAYRRHAKGNSLYRNRGDGTFEETGGAEGVEQGRWAWSSGGFDFDLDGIPEIFIASGMSTDPRALDLNSFFWRQVVAKSPSTAAVDAAYENGWNAIGQMFRGPYSWNGREPNVFYVREKGRYRDYSGVSGLDFADDSRAFAVTDFDGDGMPDVIVKNRLGPQIRALQNSFTKEGIGIRLQGVKSNRNGIGAKVEVNGKVQFVTAGSGFLSQHSLQLHFGMAGRERADVTITWPSGVIQKLAGLASGASYRIIEESPTFTRTAFRRKSAWTGPAPVANNKPEFEDTWLLEPVPTPEKCAGPGFVTITAENLSRAPESTAAAWSLFRRYLFEYRTELQLPLVLLVDEQSRARRVYAAVPGEATKRADLANIGNSRKLALPFAGRYRQEPHRQYFKMGAAFYWAGYPERALPYLEEALNAKPENWKAMLAIGSVHQELGHAAPALEYFQKAIALRPDYVPALVSAGEILLGQRELAKARELFLRAIEKDPKSAEAYNQLGMLSVQSADPNGARAMFERALTARAGDAGAANNLGVLFAQMGETDNAIAALKYGVDHNPDHEALALNLSMLYLRSGQRDRARAVIGNYLDRHSDSVQGRKILAQIEAQ